MFQALAFHGGDVRPRVSWLKGSTTAGLPKSGMGPGDFLVPGFCEVVVVAFVVALVEGVTMIGGGDGERCRTAAYVGRMRTHEAMSVVDMHERMHVVLLLAAGVDDVDAEHESIGSGSSRMGTI